MKQLLLFILTTALLISCGVITKVFHRSKSAADSTVVTLNSSSNLKKREQAGSQKIVSGNTANIDSSYSRTTIVKEYLATTSSAPGDYFVPDSQERKNRKLLYREIVVAERGKLQRADQQNNAIENFSSVQKTDSAAKLQKRKVDLKKSADITNKEVVKKKRLAGWTWWLVILLISLAIYCYYKKYTPAKLWQAFSRHIK